MAAFLDPDRTEEPESTEGGAACLPASAERRCCKVLEYGRSPGAAVLYVFYRVDDEAAGRRPTTSRIGLRIPGRGWRNAVDFRAGDMLQLPDGRIALVEKLVAAPRLDDVHGQPAKRLRTYRAGHDGTWARDGAVLPA